MISTYSAAMANCAKYRDHEGFAREITVVRASVWEEL